MSAGWQAQAKARHTRALGSPQAFALTGDGELTLGVLESPEREPGMLGVRLAEARYRDWQTNGGLFSEERHATAAPMFELSEEPRAIRDGKRDKRDERACAILRALIDEFGELFPDEFAQARAYLAQ